MNRRRSSNTRDEPHADTEKIPGVSTSSSRRQHERNCRRFEDGHDIVVLDLIENGWCPMSLDLVDPIAALKIISRDPTLKTPVQLVGGRTISPVDLQREYFAAAQKTPAGRIQIPMDARRVARGAR